MNKLDLVLKTQYTDIFNHSYLYLNKECKISTYVSMSKFNYKLKQITTKKNILYVVKYSCLKLGKTIIIIFLFEYLNNLYLT